jgi:hypothetical protein
MRSEDLDICFQDILAPTGYSLWSVSVRSHVWRGISRRNESLLISALPGALFAAVKFGIQWMQSVCVSQTHGRKHRAALRLRLQCYMAFF